MLINAMTSNPNCIPAFTLPPPPDPKNFTWVILDPQLRAQVEARFAAQSETSFRPISSLASTSVVAPVIQPNKGKASVVKPLQIPVQFTRIFEIIAESKLQFPKADLVGTTNLNGDGVVTTYTYLDNSLLFPFYGSIIFKGMVSGVNNSDILNKLDAIAKVLHKHQYVEIPPIDNEYTLYTFEDDVHPQDTVCAFTEFTFNKDLSYTATEVDVYPPKVSAPVLVSTQPTSPLPRPLQPREAISWKPKSQAVKEATKVNANVDRENLYSTLLAALKSRRGIPLKNHSDSESDNDDHLVSVPRASVIARKLASPQKPFYNPAQIIQYTHMNTPFKNFHDIADDDGYESAESV
jgi:hypothetical protein